MSKLSFLLKTNHSMTNKRGRPPKSPIDKVLTMKLLRTIERESGLLPAELENDLLSDDSLVEEADKQSLGAKWNRYARGDRFLSNSALKALHEKALARGLLRTVDGDFSFMEIKEKVRLSRKWDGIHVRQLKDTRQSLQNLRETLSCLEDGCWDNVEIVSKSMEYRKERTQEALYCLDKILSGIRFSSFVI